MSIIKGVLKIGVPLALTAAAYALSKLHEQSAPVKEKPRSDAPIIAALGDSITFGAGVAATRKTDSWEVKLEKLLGGSYQVLNYGISGATLQNEGNKPYWNYTDKAIAGFPEAAMSLNPSIMLFMLGTNDSKPYNWDRERYEAQLDMRIKEMKQAVPQTRLILMCPPFCCPVDGAEEVSFDIHNEIIRDEVGPIMKKCAEENEVECIDLYALTEGHPEYFTDGVHPNSFGNLVIAKAIAKYLNENP